MRWAHQRQAWADSWEAMRHTSIATGMTVLVVAAVLLLPIMLQLLMDNISGLMGNWDGKPNASLYLKLDTPAAQRNKMIKQIRARQDVLRVIHTSPEQGLAMLAEQEGMGYLKHQYPQGSPLPHVLTVTPTAELDQPGLLEAWVSELRRLPDVELAKLDLAWLERLAAWLALGQGVLDLFFVVSCAVLLLVVANTTRLQIQNRACEIDLLALLGAPARFIRRPFIYQGALLGAMGGCLAGIISNLCASSLHSQVATLANQYHLFISIKGLEFGGLVLITLGSAGLGAVGAWLTLLGFSNRIVIK